MTDNSIVVVRHYDGQTFFCVATYMDKEDAWRLHTYGPDDYRDTTTPVMNAWQAIESEIGLAVQYWVSQQSSHSLKPLS